MVDDRDGIEAKDQNGENFRSLQQNERLDLS